VSENELTPGNGAAFCLSCGYPLNQLPEHRCPECGRAFDPANPRTLSLGYPLKSWQRWLLKPIGWPNVAVNRPSAEVEYARCGY
jgi:hypothetical protein